jgi:hypothetical protein
MFKLAALAVIFEFVLAAILCSPVWWFLWYSSFKADVPADITHHFLFMYLNSFVVEESHFF